MSEKSFEELFNESLKEEKFDRTVTGKVISVSSKGEIFVDFGYKADGIIPKAEYSEDENKNPKDEFKPGDTITADVLKWNDGLGNVLLSYKRLQKREKAKQEKIKREEEYKKRQEQRELKAKNIEEFWNNMQVGQTYTGTITKITDFGLFVDLGARQGLLHKSEIFWNKDEKPEDKFEVGQQIDVTVKSFNKEENKISLAYPLKGENPWYELASKYNLNDIVTCEVVKFAPFGGFLQIEKGLEGLVHNSEISTTKRVTKPEEVLNIGQKVNAKIINIDKENRKIGLSIKELEGTSKEYGYEEFINNIEGEDKKDE